MSKDLDLELADRALRQMRSTVVPVENPEGLVGRRTRLVAALEREIQAVPRRRIRHERLVRGLWSLASVAAVAVLVWGGIRLGQGEANVVEPGAPMAAAAVEGAQLRSWSGDVSVGTPGHVHALEASEGTSLGVTSVLATRQSGWVELELPGAVRVEVNAETELQVLEAQPESRHVRLTRGRVDLKVPKPKDGPATRLVVSTPDAEVEVRGTIFSVEVRPGRLDPSRMVTEVVVSRGAVMVRHEGREHAVPAGSRWTSEVGGASAPLPKKDVRRPRDELPAQGTQSSKTGNRTDKKVDAGATSTLAEQNRLFERALLARDRGDWEEVVELCDRFLARYPNSALVDSVRLERSRAAERVKSDGSAR